MRRPRWIGVLVLALVVAGVFAGLGKWQLTRAVQARQVGPQITETTRRLGTILDPGKAIASDRVGQLVTVSVRTVPADYVLIQDRDNGGTRGWWVVAHTVVTDGADEGAHLAVARGFAATRQAAVAAQRKLEASVPENLDLTGRLLPTEAPEQPEDSEDGDPPKLQDLSVAALINLWSDLGESPRIYEAYVVARTDVPEGLTAIYAPPPIQQRSIDWLNAFYAAEWAVFAGFAVYLWYRLAKDAWEREVEDLEAAAALETGGADAPAARSPQTEKVD
ncbi:SURF1 family protein [Gryllotalpicola ginsengisoli]|uniref:SURF1 family protein n=1 Tax=Gryllotalpicola ginsengisoli TaxID=444608 RepID=UPI0003F60427|nr:SURF1 family cytochrome oxidase biogenesis protein [Gryllotalpicola ginsengisoli]